MYYGTQRADIPRRLPPYDYSKTLMYHLIACGVAFFDFNVGRMLTLCDLPGPGHLHYIPCEYATCYEYDHAERNV